ncbi:NACHT domain-containing protein [Ectopseudomonas alcaliphila]|uniref:NACHT domain-containing protein n=1 Tax=Ectopseudomonas alcaliphila TaxID=101564 RepID=A0A1G6WJ52_9GAMM|nr:NACHT domain-containing protein [Pseudomonas alcaliphila]MDX5992047.1 NACHT domain-containing protein [Pseudomonas alcaliphila]SDD65105.1 NACHT domain-containing protein [Pseudomonas alcaliphila]
MTKNTLPSLGDTIGDLVKSLVPDIIGAGDKEYKKYQVKLESCFKRHITRTHSKYSKIKTLLYRDKPVSLQDHYVAGDFFIAGESHNGDDLLPDLLANKRNVIVGTAGSGKSVLLRKLAIEAISQPRGVIPVLVELRLLRTRDGDLRIGEYLFNTISDQDEGFSKDQLHTALKLGKILLLLDGFDEIDFQIREAYEEEVLELSNKYPQTPIVLSSRPDSIFNSWEEFYIYRALPLNQAQSIELISKIDYDAVVKERFIKELSEGLYDKHSDFLSNPLLLTMMLLTYEQLAEIPEKIHIFYEQAFDTLFHKHDALKYLYKRKSYSNLPVDDFKKVFSAFCLTTYYDRRMSFTQSEVLDYIQQAADLEDVSASANNIFNDLVKSVCILQKDGNYFTFSHRSFQEYFAAVFISRSNSIDTGKALDVIVRTSQSDNVIPLAWELNRERIETKWIHPRLRVIIRKCEKLMDEDKSIEFLSQFFESFAIPEKGHVGYGLSERKSKGYFLIYLYRLYRDESNKVFGWRAEGAQKAELEQWHSSLLEELKKAHPVEPEDDELDMRVPLAKVVRTPAILKLAHLDCEKHLRFFKMIEEQIYKKYNRREKALAKLILRGHP